MDEGNGLENRRSASYRGFESHPLRQVGFFFLVFLLYFSFWKLFFFEFSF